ncbi:MAG: 1-(5-phosphoribosyl)-5-[(5-phosphoribosylamino)methylideneamino]imidazole-4-carboxamide isomerase, partial [Rhodospirillaceae bacterium]|nr:1-(5-phosphoribosyl)-5-[(5-phosphoribosylamino)methylideneamino]imidazole-4-carboxamide isomerase [Rhodospirillaceae bacterium]
MIFFPAIDLKEGQCVRLLKGDMNKATVFGDDPGAQAASFVKDGAEWLHVVDLDGAFAGSPKNADAVKSIVAALGNVPMQLGGGIRNMETISAWLDGGVRRVILGTIALNDPDLVFAACKQYPGRIAVGIDAKNGMVATEGWANVSDITALELAKKFEQAGVGAIIHTDIARDGAMAGPNWQASLEIAMAVSIPLIISGGVSSMDDLNILKENCGTRISGVISGRAIYDGAFTV